MRGLWAPHVVVWERLLCTSTSFSAFMLHFSAVSVTCVVFDVSCHRTVISGDQRTHTHTRLIKQCKIAQVLLLGRVIHTVAHIWC